MTDSRVVGLNLTAELPGLHEPAVLGDAELAALLAAGGVVVDVRTAEAFDAGHLAGALSLPLQSGSIGTRAGWLLDAERPIAIVCASGGRAVVAASALRARLPQPVLRVDGGIADVLAALEREPAAL